MLGRRGHLPQGRRVDVAQRPVEQLAPGRVGRLDPLPGGRADDDVDQRAVHVDRGHPVTQGADSHGNVGGPAAARPGRRAGARPRRSPKCQGRCGWSWSVASGQLRGYAWRRLARRPGPGPP